MLTRNFLYFILFLILLVVIYYFLVSNYRTALVSLINFLAILFLLTNSKKVKSIIYPFFFIILTGEILVFSYDIISGFNIRNVFDFFRLSGELSPSIYAFKSTRIFGIDTNIYAPFFAVSTIIFKQFNRKILTIISFIMLFLTFSRASIFLTLVILLFPEKKVNLKYLYFLIGIGMFFFLNYQGDNLSLNLKVSTYLLFFKSFSTLGPVEFLLGTSNLDEEITDQLLIDLGQVTQGHTLPGAVLTFGLIYIFASMVIFYILWRKNKFMRLPIIFLITYSLFSVTSFSIPTPLLVTSSLFGKNYKNKIKIPN